MQLNLQILVNTSWRPSFKYMTISKTLTQHRFFVRVIPTSSSSSLHPNENDDTFMSVLLDIHRILLLPFYPPCIHLFVLFVPQKPPTYTQGLSYTWKNPLSLTAHNRDESTSRYSRRRRGSNASLSLEAEQHCTYNISYRPYQSPTSH